MKLYGPNNQMTLIAEDDDSGSGNNAKISHHLVVGSYVVQVRHYRPRGTGKYSILVQTGAL